MDFHDRRDGTTKPRHVLEREEKARLLEASQHKLVSKGRGAVHITNIAPRGDYGANAGTDQGRGYVQYAPESHCPAVSRMGPSKYTHAGFNDLSEAVARLESGVHGKPCATCLTAAKANL